MSLNYVMLSLDGQTPVPLADEKMFSTQDGVNMELDCTENNCPDNSASLWHGKGKVILSNQRIIWLSSNPAELQLRSLNIPIRALKNWKLEQPWFGANYITGLVLPVPGGGLPRHGNLRLTFQNGGATEFALLLQSLLERMQESSAIPQHLEQLPTYTSDPPSRSDLPPKYEDI